MARRSSTGSARGDDRQLALAGLFEIPKPVAPTDGSLDYESELCRCLSRALKETPLSRAGVAARMSDLTGRTITESMLNSWTAESRELHRFPFAFAAAFEVACETTCLQELVARKRGSKVYVGKEALDAELGRIERMQVELRQRKRALVSFMGSQP